MRSMPYSSGSGSSRFYRSSLLIIRRNIKPRLYGYFNNNSTCIVMTSGDDIVFNSDTTTLLVH
jgi:hypothetical protein